jgi:hypothetical protein
VRRLVDSPGTPPYRSAHTSIKAQPAKAGAAKPRVLASSATPSIDATKGPTTAELPKVLLCRVNRGTRRRVCYPADSAALLVSYSVLPRY